MFWFRTIALELLSKAAHRNGAISFSTENLTHRMVSLIYVRA